MNEGQIGRSLQALNVWPNELLEQNMALQHEQVMAQRYSEHVTPEMVSECRTLLDLFGIPYITSTPEAEQAHCPRLVDGKLLHGRNQRSWPRHPRFGLHRLRNPCGCSVWSQTDSDLM